MSDPRLSRTGSPLASAEDDAAEHRRREDHGAATLRRRCSRLSATVITVIPHSIHDLVYPGSGSKYRAHAFSCDQAAGVLDVQMPDEISSVGWYALNELTSPLTPSAQAVLSQM